MMRIALTLCTALFIAACANSPTAPTPIATPPPASSPSTSLANLRWDVTAPGCPVKAPPSPIPDPAQARLEPGPHGTIIAYWTDYRLGVLQATLVERDAELLVCDWDVADI